MRAPLWWNRLWLWFAEAEVDALSGRPISVPQRKLWRLNALMLGGALALACSQWLMVVMLAHPVTTDIAGTVTVGAWAWLAARLVIRVLPQGMKPRVPSAPLVGGSPWFVLIVPGLVLYYLLMKLLLHVPGARSTIRWLYPYVFVRSR